MDIIGGQGLCNALGRVVVDHKNFDSRITGKAIVFLFPQFNYLVADCHWLNILSARLTWVRESTKTSCFPEALISSVTERPNPPVPPAIATLTMVACSDYVMIRIISDCSQKVAVDEMIISFMKRTRAPLAGWPSDN